MASKSVVLFYPKPARCYTDTAAFDSVDLSDIDNGNGEPVAVVQEAKYLLAKATYVNSLKWLFQARRTPSARCMAEHNV